MYYSYFGLTTAPFSIAPNPDYLLMTERHQEALAHLYHGIGSDAGFVLLTGDVGTGKTTVCREFLNHLPEHTQVAFILNPCLDSLELLQAICHELQIDNVIDGASLRQLSDSIYQHLLQNHARGINTVLLIDEAQQMHKTVLELIRLLTNLETDTQKLLKIILVGQPELNQILDQPDLVQLSQRITARYHIKPLMLNELSAYIHHRLQAAGYRTGKKLFPQHIVKQLFMMSRGVPRVINVICDRALLGVYAQGKMVVTKTILRNAYQEVKGNYIAPQKKKKSTLLVILTIFGLSLFGVAIFLWPLPTATYLLDMDKKMSLSVNEKSAPIVLEHKNLSQSVPVISDKLLVDDIVPVAIAPTSIPTVKPEPVIIEAKYFEDKNQAIAGLVNSIIESNVVERDCQRLALVGWRCENTQVISWSAFKKINRPAILRLNRQGQLFYVAVTGMTQTHLIVLSEKDTVPISLSAMGEYWTGDFTYLWQVPENFERFIYKGASSNLVEWLANSFATIDGRQSLLAEKQYNRLLEQRIKLFQRKHQLKEDGKAGVETLLTLNESLGRAVTLDTPKVSVPATVN